MTKETIINTINTLASVKVEVNEAPKIIGAINLLQQELKREEEDDV